MQATTIRTYIYIIYKTILYNIISFSLLLLFQKTFAFLSVTELNQIVLIYKLR